MGSSLSVRDLDAFIRWAPYPVVVFEPDFTMVSANEAFLRSLKVSRDSVLGKNVFNIFPENPDDPAADGPIRFRASLERVLATGSPDRMPVTRYDIPRPDDEGGGFEVRYWDPSSYPVLDDQGQVTHIIHQSEDVTELMRLRQRDDEHTAKLAEANSLYQAIYDQGLFAGRLDLDGTVTDANRSCLEQCGYTREDVIGRAFWECGWWNRSPEAQAWVKAGIEQAVRGEPFRGVSTYFWADGTERVVEYACMPIKDEAGKVLFVVPTGIDITERFWAERDQWATEILESITDAFFAVSRDWRLTYVNRQAERVLGRTAVDLIGKVLWDVFPGLVGSEFERVYRQAASEGIASSITSFYPDHNRWYEVHTYPAPHGISVHFRDVSERRQAEAERERLVADSENQRLIYEAALSNTPDFVYVFDLDHRFIYANEALLKLWGRTRENALGKNCLQLGYEPWHAAMHDREIEQVVSTRQPIRGEVPFTGTSGRRIYDYIFVPVVGVDGAIVAVAGTTRDVTDRQRTEQAVREQAEQLRENDRRKDEFLAMLAHELRNPISAIANAVQVARQSRCEESQEWSQEVIGRQVKHLSRLIDDLLDVSRITRGKIQLKRQIVELSPIVSNAIESVQPLIEGRKHRLIVSFAPQRLRLHADATRVEQIVVNLLTNAAKYTDYGGQIWLTTSLQGDNITITVRDSGVGISPEALPRMFELFAQGDRSLARSEGGLGIGLTLVRSLAEMHGGKVTARSEGLGKGSEFTVTLPAAKVSDETSRKPMGTLDRRARQGSRILVVDDNVDSAHGIACLLNLLGHTVEMAHEGQSAIEAAKSFRPEFVLLDIGLPGMNGYQIAEKLRAEESSKDAVIIAVSGYAQEADRRRSKEAGFDHHLAKPVDHDALMVLLSAGSTGSQAEAR